MEKLLNRWCFRWALKVSRQEITLRQRGKYYSSVEQIKGRLFLPILQRTGRTWKNQTAYRVLKSIHQIKVCQAVETFESVLNGFFDKERAFDGHDSFELHASLNWFAVFFSNNFHVSQPCENLFWPYSNKHQLPKSCEELLLDPIPERDPWEVNVIIIILVEPCGPSCETTDALVC